MMKSVLFYVILYGCMANAVSASSTEVSHANAASYYKALGEKYFQQRDYEKAYRCLWLSDSLENIQYRQQLMLMEKEYSNLQAQIRETEETNNAYSLKTKKINRGILMFALLDVMGLLIFLYMEKQRAYLKLVRKNVEWAKQANSYKSFISKDEEDTWNKDQITAFDTKEQELLLKFIHVFKTEKIYLKSDVSILDIAKLLNCNKVLVSKIINNYFQKSFPSLLNEYRIKEAICLLTDKKNTLYKLEAIGEMCGYKNRQVFHMVFKRMTGITPNDFRKMSMSKDFDND